MKNILEARSEGFFFGGKPLTILSGTIHYFRTLPGAWEDRLRKLKACGFNTVETYVPWNAHEPERGRFDFEGILDIEAFLATAAKLGLYAIVRPSPYICAEWELGGLPSWLLKDRSMDVRSADPEYLKAVEEFYAVLIPKLVPFLSSRGGPILAMQIENEYGSYGCDKKYLRFLRDCMRKYGADCLLFTSDGPCDMMLKGGTLPEILPVANFGSGTQENLRVLQEYRPGIPLMCGEFWCGWFDHWGEEHHSRDAKSAAEELDRFFDLNASVNVYTFHGGTNFGFLNGANAEGARERDCVYQPTVTSYDDDALLTEDGRLTPKYREVQKVFEKRLGKLPEVEMLPQPERISCGKAGLTSFASLYDRYGQIGKLTHASHILSMEDVGQDYGYINYRTHVDQRKNVRLTLNEIHDRAAVYINGKYIRTLYRNDKENSVIVDFDQEDNILDILVENMGRVNYGRFLKDRKGITEQVLLDYRILCDWEIWSVRPDDLLYAQTVPGVPASSETPAIYEGSFEVKTVGDTFVKVPNLNRGAIWVNGFCLGRYWNEKGPQKTLYVPAQLLQEGENRLRIFEFDPSKDASAELLDTPEL